MDAVTRALCPTVHCFATPDVDHALHRNQLASLSQLVEPFIASLDQVQLRLPSTYEQRTARHFHLNLVDRQLPDPVSSTTTPHQAPTPSFHQPLALRDELFLDQLGQRVALLADPDSHPPYPLVRDAVLARPPDDYCVAHESFAHPVACLVALSTSHPDPLNALATLWDLTSPRNLFRNPAAQADDPRAEYAAPDVLRFVVLVHDHGAPGAQGPDAARDAHKLLDTVRKTYGNHSALVDLFSAAEPGPGRRPRADEAEVRRLWRGVIDAQAQAQAAAARGAQDGIIGLGFDAGDEGSLPQASSAPTPAPDPALVGHELSSDDLSALRQLAREFVVQSLVPFLEQRAVVLHEQWQASRRSIGGRLFSVGRKYFGGGGGGGGGAGASGREGSREGSSGAGKEGYNAAKGYYHHSSPSALARRLADTAFFLGDYKLAFTVYDACAKDFRADKAARHAAAAMRMSAICAVLLLPPSAPPSSSSSTVSHAPPPQLVANPEALLAGAAALSPLHGALVDFDALRSTLVLVALYALHQHLAPLAPLALVRAAGDAEEIVAAVLLEEAAGAELRAGGRWPQVAGRGGLLEGEGGSAREGEEDGRERERRVPRSRKHAFWMALAAARYEKCGVKSLSRRCLSQAAALYLPAPSSSSSDPSVPPPIASLASPTRPPPHDPAQWSAIRTHLHHALARQSYTVGAAQDSVDNFLALLGTSSGPAGAASASASVGGDGAAGASGDGAASDAPEWLDDFALAWDLLASSSSLADPSQQRAVTLPIRLFDAPHARLRVGSARQAGLSAGAGDDAEWARLEQALLARAEFDVGSAARPSALGYRGGASASVSASAGRGRGPSALEPVEAVLGETLTLEVPVRNPLEAFLALGALAVEVRREAEGDAEGEGRGGSGLEVSAPQDVELAPGESSKILIPIRASSLGTFTFDSLSYSFSNLVPVREPLSPARWSKPTAPRPGKPSARVALPLRVRVRAAVPVLGVDMSALPSRLFHGEQSGDDQTTTIIVRNEGPVPLTDLHALSSQPDSLLLRPAPPTLAADGALATSNDLAAARPTALLEPGRTLAPGESLAVPVVVRGSRVGAHALCVLFAFRAADGDGEGGKGAREYLSTRAAHGVEVYPSLELRYGVRSGRRNDSPLVLGVEVHNVGLPADDVSISAISLLSPRWRISPAADSSAFEEDVASQRIGWQQGLTTFVPVAAVAREEREGPSEEADLWTAGQVEALLDGKDVKGMPPHAKVGVSSLSSTSSTSSSSISSSALSGLLAAYTSYRRAWLVERYPTVPPALHPSLFPLFSSRSAALVVTFTSSTLSLAPAHLLIPLDAPYLGSALGSPAAAALVRVLVNAERRSGGLYEESRRERRALLTVLKRSEIIGAAGTDEAPPVAADVAVRGVVEHDFSSSGPLSLPLRLSLLNLSPSTTFSYTLSLSSPSSRTGAGVILSGALTHRGALGPLGRTSVEAQLWVPRPGVFAAGAWDLVLSWDGANAQEPGGSVRLSGGAREVRVRDSQAVRVRSSAAVALEEAARVEVRA